MLSANTASAGVLGDAPQGLVHVQKNCSECHAVKARERRSPDPDAPSFESVASTPGMNRQALYVWLKTPHPTMPNFIIPRNETDDIISYVQSLRTE